MNECLLDKPQQNKNVNIFEIFQPEEDEETRKYRLEIEKQKALREKVLRDKEQRRRKAVEEISGQKDEVRTTTFISFSFGFFAFARIC